MKKIFSIILVVSMLICMGALLSSCGGVTDDSSPEAKMELLKKIDTTTDSISALDMRVKHTNRETKVVTEMVYTIRKDGMHNKIVKTTTVLADPNDANTQDVVTTETLEDIYIINTETGFEVYMVDYSGETTVVKKGVYDDHAGYVEAVNEEFKKTVFADYFKLPATADDIQTFQDTGSGKYSITFRARNMFEEGDIWTLTVKIASNAKKTEVLSSKYRITELILTSLTEKIEVFYEYPTLLAGDVEVPTDLTITDIETNWYELIGLKNPEEFKKTEGETEPGTGESETTAPETPTEEETTGDQTPETPTEEETTGSTEPPVEETTTETPAV